MPEKKLNRILHVDDEADIREIAQLALEDVGGYSVEMCESGKAALAIASEFRPDLILLDVMMPNMTGPETLEHLRGLPETADTPVIFMTAKVQRKELETLKKLGALGIIEKPFDPMGLSDQIVSYWEAYCHEC